MVGRTGVLVLVVVCGLVAAARAQSVSLAYDVVYRPSTVRYQVLESTHFDVIYQEGAEPEAREAAAILEEELAQTQALVGLRRPLRMPVVLNQFSDRANGYVTALPFKQEIEAVNIRGNRLSARYSSWMWAVAPHELVHAVHAEVGAGFGVGRAIRWFSPDLARALNLWFPVGMTEGAAVFHESRVQDGAGRLNFSLFQMQFRAAMGGERPWRLAQMLEAPAYSQPLNRFYIGGANLFEYLAAADDARFFRRALAFHNRFPLLGHGVELWYGTGVRPDNLGRRFRRAMREAEEERLAALGAVTQPNVVAQGPGRHHRRPRWLDDSTLVAYVSGYATRPGFYRIDAETGRRQPIGYQGITEDFYFSLTGDSTAVLFARYVRDPLVTIQALADVYRLDLATGKAMALTEDGRVFAPVTGERRLWAMQNDGQFNRWVVLDSDGQVHPLTDLPRASFIQLAPSPVDETVAAIVQVDGRQGLFRASMEETGQPTLTPWLFFEDASLFDVDWSTDGRYLLFSADLDGVANIFAYDHAADRVLQLTNAAYGAQEPTLSPSGATLAFVHYQHERYDLVRIPFRPEAAEVVSPARRVSGGPDVLAGGSDAASGATYAAGEPKPYRALSHLKPRMLYPTVRYEQVDEREGDTDLGIGVGVGLQGADPLNRWAYGAEAFYQGTRLWGRLSVATASTFLRPVLSFYDVPSTVVVSQRNANNEVVGTRRVGREERGLALGIRFPVIFQSNVFSTTASLSLQARYEQERLFDEDGETIPIAGQDGQSLDAFRSRFRLTPSATLAYRVQSNLRDLLPNTGTVLATTASVDAWQEGQTSRRAAIVQLAQYFPFLMRSHTGLRVQSGLLTQNQGSIYNLDRFVPRGYEDELLDAGTFLRLDMTVLQPLWYIDNGLVLLPAYFKALYAYGFAETLFPVDGKDRSWTHFSSVGAGLGLQMRLFYVFNVDLRVGAAYLPESERWDVVFR